MAKFWNHFTDKDLCIVYRYMLCTQILFLEPSTKGTIITVYYGSLYFVKSSIAMGNLSHVLLLHVKITHKVWKPFLKRFIGFLFILNWLGHDLGILNFGLQIYFDRPYPSFGHTRSVIPFLIWWVLDGFIADFSVISGSAVSLEEPVFE